MWLRTCTPPQIIGLFWLEFQVHAEGLEKEFEFQVHAEAFLLMV